MSIFLVAIKTVIATKVFLTMFFYKQIYICNDQKNIFKSLYQMFCKVIKYFFIYLKAKNLL